MSGKTPAQVDSSLREALKAWSGFEEPFEWEYLSVGLINQTWCVTRGSTQTIVQCVNEVFSPRVQDNIQIVSKHLEERGLVSPRLLETRDGALFAELPEGSRWRVMNKVPGIAFRRCESEDQARSAAMYAARFHNALSDFRRGTFTDRIPLPRHGQTHGRPSGEAGFPRGSCFPFPGS